MSIIKGINSIKMLCNNDTLIFQMYDSINLNITCPINEWAIYYFTLQINSSEANVTFGILSKTINYTITQKIILGSAMPIANYVPSFGEFSSSIISKTQYYNTVLDLTSLFSQLQSNFLIRMQ